MEFPGNWIWQTRDTKGNSQVGRDDYCYDTYKGTVTMAHRIWDCRG